MNPKIARWCASLIVDEWPIPSWFAQKLRSHPDVVEALNHATDLEAHLSMSTNVSKPKTYPQRSIVQRDADSRRHVLFCLALTTAAAGLFCMGWWSFADRDIPNDPGSVGPIAKSIDTEPIFASLSAGQTVAQRVSFGLESVASDLLHAGNRLAAPFTNRGDEDASSSDQQAPPESSVES